MSNPKYIAFSNTNDRAFSIPGQTNSASSIAGLDDTKDITADTGQSIPVYKLAGHFKMVNGESEKVPFARDQLVDDSSGFIHRILCVDDRSYVGHPVISVRTATGNLFRWRTDGTSALTGHRLDQKTIPGKSEVKFVPVAD